MIPDREKIIKGLEDIQKHLETGYSFAISWENELIRDAISMLKEQEAIEPDVDSEGTCTCGNCGENVGWYPVGSKEPVRLCKFCSECGHEVKWE